MPETVTVATFNIHHGEGRDGRVDLERVAAAIEATSADLIALQEIDRNLSRSGRVDQVTELERLTGLSIRFHPTLERGDGDYGIGLAAREPLEARFEGLPRAGGEEPRGAIVASWRDVSVIATHLSRDRRARRSQLTWIEGAVPRRGSALVLGDLNQSWRKLAGLRARGFMAARPDGAGGPLKRQIDHVLVGPGLFVVASRFVSSEASDHVPLVAEVALLHG